MVDCTESFRSQEWEVRERYLFTPFIHGAWVFSNDNKVIIFSDFFMTILAISHGYPNARMYLRKYCLYCIY